MNGRRKMTSIPWGLRALLILTVSYATAAADTLDEARRRADQYRAQMDLANTAYAQGDAAAVQAHQEKAAAALRDAIHHYQAGGVNDAQDAAALGSYAELLGLHGDYDLAAQAVRAAIALEPADASLWLSLAANLSRLGTKEEPPAKAAFERSLELDESLPTLLRAHAGLADLYMRAGLFDLARDHFEEAAAAAPEEVSLKIALAALDIRVGRVRQGSDALDALGMLSQNHLTLMRELLGDSLRDFNRDRLWIPDTAEDHLAYAKLMMRTDNIEECLHALERSSALDDGNFITWNLLGSLSRQVGNTERAREAFRRSLRLKPDQPRTKEALSALDAVQE